MKLLIFCALAGAVPAAASATDFFDNFDVDSTASWVFRSSVAGDTAANGVNGEARFFFDYGAMGIPSAPGSAGTTRGLRLEANVNGTVPGVFSGLSVSPIGQSFTGDYKLTAQVWLNFLGPLPAGGRGTTQVGGMGIGTAGATPQWAGGTQDSVHFGTTLDGNSAVDWRAYSSAAGTGYPDASPVFAAAGAGNRNNTHPYYSGFGGAVPPAAQTALFPTQTGATNVGTVGFRWNEMVVEKLGNSITWRVNGLLIATVNASTVALGGSNILLNMFDTNATVALDPNHLNFVLYDNVSVVPEPATMAVLGFGALAMLRKLRRK